MDFASDSLDALLEEAKAGSPTAIGCLMQEFRQYLLTVANDELPVNLRAKVAPSDIVQDSCLEAQVSFPQFNGKTQAELVNWLRTILRFNISNARRHYCDAAKRDVNREQSLSGPLSNDGMLQQIAADGETPSQAAIQHEEVARIEWALTQLSDDHRQAVVLRQREHLTFAEIGRRLDRSGEAARKLWSRGVEELQQLLSEGAGPPHERHN